MTKKRRDDEENGRRISYGSSATTSSQGYYTIGWICALSIEMAAAHAMLDDIHPDVPNHSEDYNGYIFGAIGGHYVVIACLPSGVYGTTPAALVASQMRSSFPSIRFYLMVGIGGGVPTTADIRLGDVVIGIPTGRFPGVVQYDRGKTVAGGRFEQTGTLNKPHWEILSTVSKLRAINLVSLNRIPVLLAEAVEKLPAGVTTFARPEQEDILFRAEYDHVDGDTCDHCDRHEIWQGYAAATAAAYAKELLLTLPAIKSPHTGRGSLEDPARSPDTKIFLGDYKMRTLRSLSFPHMDSRRNNIASAHKNTCNWIFETEQFRQWLRRDNIESFNGVLWIKGKPGAGKSTLMKQILLFYRKSFSNHFIAAYFFNARGTLLEKSRQGMLRSLLYQLLDQDSNACDNFIPHFIDKEKKHGNSWEWCEGELESLLIGLIPSLDQPILLLVDALDECDESEVRRVVSFLEGLSSAAVSASKVSLRICLSSRHYPTISMLKMLGLVVEKRKEHAKDIATYVQDRLRLKDRDIESELRRKSAGIFMWIVLVVEMLNQAYDNGSIHAVRMKLREIPSDLDNVFRILLEKDNPDKSQTMLMLLLVLFTKRQLKPEEFYYAVLSGSEPGSLGRRESSIVTDQLIERFIISGSKGLIEVRNGDHKSVQFIHETVNDFLLRNKRLQTLDSALAPDVVGVGHQRIVSCCLAYVGMGDFMAEPLKELDDMAGDHFDENYPFLEYTASYIFYHAEHAQAGQEAFIQYLQDNSKILQMLNAMYNIYACGIGYGTKQERERCGAEASLLYMLSLHHCPKLVRILLRDPSVDINARGGRYMTALRAAVAATTYREDTTEEVIQLLLDAGVDVNINGGIFSHVLQAAVISDHRGDGTPDYSKTATIVSMLIKAGADVNAQGGFFGNALQAAAAMAGAESTDRDSGSSNISKVIQVLLDAGADVNAQGGYFGNALQAAAAVIGRNLGPSNISEVIQLLLEAGADVNARGGYFGSALQAAAAAAAAAVEMDWRSGLTKISKVIQMLLNAGANVNAEGGEYGSALQAAAASGEYGSALQAAVTSREYRSVVQAAAASGKYGSALQAAAASGEHESVLQAAVASSEYRYAFKEADYTVRNVIKMILGTGANVNAQGGRYGSALQAAVISVASGDLPIGAGDIVAILLMAGADVNAQCGPYGNALQAAICNCSGGRSRIILTLLNFGADVNAQGGRYRSAVDAAFVTGCQHVQRFKKDTTSASTALRVLHHFGAAGAVEAKWKLDKYCRWAAANYKRHRRSGHIFLPSYDSYRDLDSDLGEGPETGEARQGKMVLLPPWSALWSPLWVKLMQDFETLLEKGLF
ncbi:hypothetical protein TWF225_006229 [Orbilia oligospora]|nr:hypothetical protein TWF225_006229 [Orbilia oligospora]